MAYLHCHNCEWEQDDFWEWKWSGLKQFWKWKSRPFGYNPLSCILEDITINIKPRIIEMDAYWAKDNGFSSSRIFSWHMLIFEIRKNIRRLFTQIYWTYGDWKKVGDDKWVCPICHKRALDID